MAEESPATKGDILALALGENLRALLKEEMGSLRADIVRIEQRLGGLERRLSKAMLDTQESNGARFKDVDTLRERVGILERRLPEIELRLARFVGGVLPRRAVARLP